MKKQKKLDGEITPAKASPENSLQDLPAVTGPIIIGHYNVRQSFANFSKPVILEIFTTNGTLIKTASLPPANASSAIAILSSGATLYDPVSDYIFQQETAGNNPIA